MQINGPSLEVARQLEQVLQNSVKEAVPVEKADKSSFGNMLNNLLSEVNEAQQVADVSLQQLAAGEESASLQDVVMKMEEADLTFSLMKEIRDKLINAYKETISMQV